MSMKRKKILSGCYFDPERQAYMYSYSLCDLKEKNRVDSIDHHCALFFLFVFGLEFVPEHIRKPGRVRGGSTVVVQKVL